MIQHQKHRSTLIISALFLTVSACGNTNNISNKVYPPKRIASWKQGTTITTTRPIEVASIEIHKCKSSTITKPQLVTIETSDDDGNPHEHYTRHSPQGCSWPIALNVGSTIKLNIKDETPWDSGDIIVLRTCSGDVSGIKIHSQVMLTGHSLVQFKYEGHGTFKYVENWRN